MKASTTSQEREKDARRKRYLRDRSKEIAAAIAWDKAHPERFRARMARLNAKPERKTKEKIYKARRKARLAGLPQPPLPPR